MARTGAITLAVLAVVALTPAPAGADRPSVGCFVGYHNPIVGGSHRWYSAGNKRSYGIGHECGVQFGRQDADLRLR